jgi:hypothetical protein
MQQVGALFMDSWHHTALPYAETWHPVSAYPVAYEQQENVGFPEVLLTMVT